MRYYDNMESDVVHEANSEVRHVKPYGCSKSHQLRPSGRSELHTFLSNSLINLLWSLEVVEASKDYFRTPELNHISKMTRGNQRDKAREKNLKAQSGEVSRRPLVCSVACRHCNFVLED